MKKIILATAILLPNIALSHDDIADQNQLILDTAITYKSQENSNINQVWKISGAMLGQEANRIGKGINIDQASLYGKKHLNDSYWLVSQVSAHSHSGETKLDLEQLYLQFSPTISGHEFTTQLGKIATNTTPLANFHSANNDFSEASLLSDVFFGRHSQDLGISVRTKYQQFSLGLELLNGDNWPASQGEMAAGVYAKYGQHIGQFYVDVNIWGQSNKANLRNDARLNSNHHSSSLVKQINYYFTGDTVQYGVDAKLGYQADDWQTSLGLNVINADISGKVSDLTQSAHMESTIIGTQVVWQWAFSDYQLAVGYDLLKIDNTFSQISSKLLLEDAGLLVSNFNPNKIAASLQYELNPELKFRLEWIKEQTKPNQIDTRIGVGVIWHYSLL
ncbi:MAG: hypothetical protein HRU22_01415 [Gammaproteobacteria bacterium]|nr:hypothetical protein [Gammaproteobacteria bacterium]